MPGFIESNITLNFPNANFFRFQDCKGYRTLSGNHFKEMDACWYDSLTNTYWLIELKDFTQATLNTTETAEVRSWGILTKAVHSLCMFLSSKHNYPYNTNLNPCFPFVPDPTTQFRFVIIIHCSQAQAPDVQLIHNKFRETFKPYAKLFGIDYYGVVEHSSAIKILPNDMVQ